MQLCGIDADFESLGSSPPVWRARVAAAEWVATASFAQAAGLPLVSIWGVDRRDTDGHFDICAAYAADQGLAWLMLALDPAQPRYPDLSGYFPAARRMQRAVADLMGLAADGAEDRRPWLRHGAWPADYFPLCREHDGLETFADAIAEDYAVVQVQGDGVHEIAVGPVHAGIIEPGHFRFSVVGEKVLRLEERLGYTHKGIEKLLERTAPADGHRIAGRVSGDSTVAYAWAYCMALESATGITLPESALLQRALMLERERVANHMGDLGALGNDAGFAFGLAQFSRLKEDWLRINKLAFGHRFMMDGIVPGGVAVPLDQTRCSTLALQCDRVGEEVGELYAIYDEHAGLQDRFIGAGRVLPADASRLGLGGMVGRASGQGRDLRCDQAWRPYDSLGVNKVTLQNGDVAARVKLRFEELLESLRLIRHMCALIADLPTPTLIPMQPAGQCAGLGWVEGWRGQVLVALEIDGDKIKRCHCHDPSWQNWPVLEHAIIGNIVPDFPLINKSFNLSYSGHDV
ncbi:MAG: NADH-quinone oxidoreductase subunit C [Burkholderiales bacterium]|nr:NADH-quinone oxidoreductase subunit C [Burkholderiales bacterium]